MYNWAKTEVMLSDRPTSEQINKDELFDNWLISFERKISQKSSPPKSEVPQDFNG